MVGGKEDQRVLSEAPGVQLRQQAPDPESRQNLKEIEISAMKTTLSPQGIDTGRSAFYSAANFFY